MKENLAALNIQNHINNQMDDALNNQAACLHPLLPIETNGVQDGGNEEESPELPQHFLNPFTYSPHPLCQRAAAQVQAYIGAHPELQTDADGGKMFGVLVVQRADMPGECHFLAAYSGLLAGRNDWPWFVPPVFDAQQPDGTFKRGEQEISLLNCEIDQMERDERLAVLRREVERLQSEAEQAIGQYKKKVEQARQTRAMLRLQRNISPEDEALLVRESQFMKAELHRLKKRWAEQIEAQQTLLNELLQAIEERKRLRKTRSDQLQRWLFDQYRMVNEAGETATLIEIFGSLPPAGTGDCCAPKLLQYAFRHRLRPLCLAEFWWGASPRQEIRHHLHFYPPCRSRCKPIIDWMIDWGDKASSLRFVSRSGERGARSEDGEQARIKVEKLKNLKVEKTNEAKSTRCKLSSLPAPRSPLLEIIHEDAHLAVVLKPVGMLSVRGKISRESVEELMRRRWHDDVNPLIVHRLDMETSGLMVVARTKWAHKELQAQFARHEVSKCYVALLDGSWPANKPKEGEIDLPIRPDLTDRPRQLVDWEHGREARTRYEVVEQKEQGQVSEAAIPPGTTLIRLYPLTGRTHQLRVHCAHREGLAMPIVGDELYGRRADRLCLHAAELAFTHPKTGQRMTFSSHPDFLS